MTLNRILWLALLAAVVAGTATSAAAQSVGPVTGEVGTEEPTDISFRIGPVLVASGLSVQRLGIDNNVFDEPVNPKRDWHALITPELKAYTRAGFIRFTVASSVDFNYYKTYSSERSVNSSLRGRAEILFSRFRPFIGGALVDTRERANAEIELRAERSEREAMGGFSLELTPITYIFAGVTSTEFTFADDEVYRGVLLAEQLDHRQEGVTLGLRRDLTPLTSLQLVGRVARDRFAQNTTRNADSRTVQTIWTFAPDALWHGQLAAGFEAFEPDDPRLEPYRGVILGGLIEWPILSATRLDVALDRRVRYSYEEADAYFVDTATTLTVTQRVIGRFDVQARGSYRRLAYGAGSVAEDADPTDRVVSGLGGVGYTFSDDSRVGFNYEFTNRESDRRRDRVFDRHRVFGSWTQKF